MTNNISVDIKNDDAICSNWFLVHTKPRLEELALINLERQGYNCYLPHLQIEKIRRRKTEVVTEPLFPRYLFIKLDISGNGQGWSPIRSTLGVSKLVYFGTQPAKVDERLVNLLRDRELFQIAETLFKPGESVVMTEGPFIGVEAIYQTSKAENRSIILLNILNKSVRIPVETAQLRKSDYSS